MDTNPLDDMVPGKEVVQPSKKPRSVGPRRLDPIQTAWKTTNNKELQHMNTKSRSVSMQLPGERYKKTKGSRSGKAPDDKLRSEYTPNDPISTISDIHELRSMDDSSTPQRMTSVAGHPKNRLYITVAHLYTSYSTGNYWGNLTTLKYPSRSKLEVNHSI